MIIGSLLDVIPFWIYNKITQDVTTYFSTTTLLETSTAGWAIFAMVLALYDIMSTVYLWKYYQRYFFSSKTIMNFMRPQMIYRRNWLLFVIIMDIISIVLVIIDTIGLYSESTGSFVEIVFLFQLNTMIDFVRFDTVRHEITIRDFTVSCNTNLTEKDIDTLIPKVC